MVLARRWHLDREQPLKDSCCGLLTPGKRKSVEVMAGLVHRERVQAARQSRPALVAKASWSDARFVGRRRASGLAGMAWRQPVVAWIVDDTGIPKKGRHSVGVA
ncbi:MAG: transposase, partial [Bryobacteraceae bacterium]